MNKSGSGNKGLDWVFILGAVAAYPKTADLLSLFSPKIIDDIFGMDMSMAYGLFCALLVEGLILFLHFDRRAYRVGMAQAVKWIMFGVSFACQVFDGYVTTDKISKMSPILQLGLNYGIPALPLIIAALVAMIGALPDDGEEVKTKPRIGLKTWIDRIWYGDKQDKNTEFSNPSPKEVVDTNLENPELVTNPNGKNEKVVNPTSRQP